MPNSHAPQDSHALVTLGLWPTRLFEGFPYVVTRVVPAMYHHMVLPDEVDEAALVDIARRQARANVLETCLVLSADSALFIGADGCEHRSKAPRGGFVVIDRLQPCRSFTQTERLVARRLALDRFIAEGPPRTGYVLGDLTCGRRPATLDEMVMLAGTQADGVPRGLGRCSGCGEWRGHCLSPSLADHVIEVHCRCANDNRCAACGRLLHTRKLNANEYSERDGRIWHTPGFSGLGHICASETPPRTTSDIRHGDH
jgi:hypothetical protein